MANFQTIIKQHNSKVLIDGKKPTNCRYKDSCPLSGKCLAKCIIYKQNLQPLTKVHSTAERQMESSKLRLTTIPDCLDTKDIQLTLNFPNTSGN